LAAVLELAALLASCAAAIGATIPTGPLLSATATGAALLAATAAAGTSAAGASAAATTTRAAATAAAAALQQTAAAGQGASGSGRAGSAKQKERKSESLGVGLSHGVRRLLGWRVGGASKASRWMAYGGGTWEGGQEHGGWCMSETGRLEAGVGWLLEGEVSPRGHLGPRARRKAGAEARVTLVRRLAGRGTVGRP
jgi:hypothetical protein